LRGRPSAEGLEFVEAPVAEAGLAGIAVVVVGIVVVIFLPYVFFVLELLVLPLLFAYRVIYDKPWTVEARSGSQRQRWQVRGWRRAGEAAADVARAREQGDEAYEPLGVERL
jgi:hypothetical protein